MVMQIDTRRIAVGMASTVPVLVHAADRTVKYTRG
jgi:hypothetical protein